MRSFQHLDRQIGKFSKRLTDEIGLSDQEVDRVATLVAAEVRFLEPAAREEIFAVSPIPLRDRIDELRAFQAFMDEASGISRKPAVTRAQIIVQNYVCFVYLGEACFRALLKASKPSSVTRRCCRYLTDNPVRAFRNAIAHSNWTYTPDFRSLVFWARRGSDSTEPLSRFVVEQAELDFWQMLSRGVAYAAYTTLEDFEGQ